MRFDFLAVICVAVTGCFPGMVAAETRGGAVPPGDAAGGFDTALATLTHGIRSADKVEIFEGLPHPFIEKEVWAAEKKAKPSFPIDGEWFYAAAQAIAPEVRGEMEALLLAPVLSPYRGLKACGGFHADYAIRWTWQDGERSVVLLVCFGCAETRVLTGGRWTTDLTVEGAAKLRELLSVFRRERPRPAYLKK